MNDMKTTDDWVGKIDGSQSLDQLYETLWDCRNALDLEARGVVWDRVLCDLPTFGGPDPADTSGIWSWDETRLLLTDGQGGFEIRDRREFEASAAWAAGEES